MVVALLLVIGEWLRVPSGAWLAGAWLGVVLLVMALLPLRGLGRVLVVVAVGLGLAATVGQWRQWRIERDWATVQQGQLRDARTRLAGALDDAVARVDRLAAAGVSAAALDQPAAFDRLAAALPTRGPEVGVAILEATGVPWAWAGRHRIPPAVDGDSIAVRWNGYYLVVEIRRHSAHGRVAVASVLIDADPAAPDVGASVAALFQAGTAVGVEVIPPGEVREDASNVAAYRAPAGGPVLLAVRPVLPDQGAVKEAAVARSRAAVAWLTLLLLSLALALASHPRERLAMLVVSLVLAVRAPLGAALGMADLFSSATFFRPLLGPLSSSRGVVAATGVVLTILAVALWRRRLRRHWLGLVVGTVALFVAPDMYRELGRGITPPTEGVSLPLWMTWQLMMVVAASALIMFAAALFRGSRDITGSRWKALLAVGVILALVAAVIGIFVWRPPPRPGWPPWYTSLWIPPLILVALPAPRWATASAVALVAGTAAALVSWGAVLEGAIAVAQRDVSRLAGEPDPLAYRSLERFAEALREAPPPTSAAELFTAWRRSDLATEGYPAHLALWRPDGTLAEEVALDSLGVGLDRVAGAVRDLGLDEVTSLLPIERVPGLHYLLLVRLRDGVVVSTVVGPRTRLIGRTRLGQLLQSPSGRAPLYDIALSPPGLVDSAVALRPLRWRREGWTVYGEADLPFLDGLRQVHVELALRGPFPILVRGILLVLLDVAVLVLLWVVAELVDGERYRWPQWRRLARSFRIRLAVALAVFFLLPAAGFAAWSFVRLTDEVQRGRDILTTRLLRTAAAAAGGLFESGRGRLQVEAQQLARRVGGEVWLYQGGRLAAASSPLLQELAAARPLLEPAAFRAMALGPAIEMLSTDATTGDRRVGYRVAVQGPPGGLGIVATPQLESDSGLEERQLDLAYVLLLATLGGIAAAIVGAQLAARALSRPVSELRRSALAIGRGEDIPAQRRSQPLEFEPVFGAFHRMVEDIRASQHALEAARQRTATVLAAVPTGVVGVDGAGAVLIANRRAEEVLGRPLAAGDMLAERLGGAWAPVGEAIARLWTAGLPEATAEFDAGGRRYSVHAAAMGPTLGGAVVAITDITDVSRAERVLAWGEMARQVAHEIKNPLTPMRLGMQHLRRVHRHQPDAFGPALEETAERILTEIDRLDRIARAFSRFAAPAGDEIPLDRVDLAEAVAEVIQLYRLAADGTVVRLDGEPGRVQAARKDEVKEVLVNLLENARQAGATEVIIRVQPDGLRVEDDGRGVPEALLDRIFEPRFSTTSSGAGLGLAIVKRVVESWGAAITVASAEGAGTVVTIAWPPTPAGS